MPESAADRVEREIMGLPCDRAETRYRAAALAKQAVEEVERHLAVEKNVSKTYSAGYYEALEKLSTLEAELAKSKERERLLDTACKRQQQRNRSWFRTQVIDWFHAHWKESWLKERDKVASLEAERAKLEKDNAALLDVVHSVSLLTTCTSYMPPHMTGDGQPRTTLVGVTCEQLAAVTKSVIAASDCEHPGDALWLRVTKAEAERATLTEELRTKSAVLFEKIKRLEGERDELKRDIDHAVSEAKKRDPDYPWDQNTASECVWALGEGLLGTEAALEDWRKENAEQAAEIARLREACEGAEVVMDAAAMRGIGDHLPPMTRDLWEHAHLRLREVLGLGGVETLGVESVKAKQLSAATARSDG